MAPRVVELPNGQIPLDRFVVMQNAIIIVNDVNADEKKDMNDEIQFAQTCFNPSMHKVARSPGRQN